METAMPDEQARMDEFRRLLDDCTRAVVFTGAGISTESGIPDFRSPGGVWTRYSPIQYQDFVSSEEARVESWRRKFDDSYGFEGAEPNRHDLEPIRIAFSADGTLPVCSACGGLVKAATISFGQPMPDGPMRRAQEETMGCDLFIAAGSSLQVYPAAGFPQIAARNGARLVILNREPTDLDSFADLVLNMEIGLTLGDAVGVN